MADRGTLAERLIRVVAMVSPPSRAIEPRTGITHAQLDLLEALREAGETTIGDLAGRVHSQQSTVSIVLRQLEQKGWVLRKRSPVDGRLVLVRLGARAGAVLRRAPARGPRRLVEVLRRMTPRERERLAQGLEPLERLLAGPGATGRESP